MDTDKQGQRGVKAAADTEHHSLGVGVLNALGQGLALHANDFLATFIKGIAGRHKRQWVNDPLKRGLPCLHLCHVYVDGAIMVGHMIVGTAMGIGRIDAAVQADGVQVDVGRDDLRLHGEPLAFRQEAAALSNERVPAKNEVLRAFAVATGTIYVGAKAARTLSCNEAVQIGGLADEFVASAKIEDDFSTSQRVVRAGRNGSPKVFANLYGEGAIFCVEEQLRTDGDRLAANEHFGIGRQGVGRSKPTLFVEFLVIGQIRLGHNATEPPLVHNGCTIVQPVAVEDGQTYDGYQAGQATAELHHAEQGGFGLVNE